MSDLEIKVVAYAHSYKAIAAIRCLVFQDEQGVAPELEFDGLDEAADHLLAYWQGEPVGTARIRGITLRQAKIERLAVLPAARRQGIGKKLMEKAVDILTQQHYQEALIHAQDYVKELYLRLGFEQIGDRFDEAGIPHVKMIKTLQPLS